MVFPSSHVRMWEMDHKESWALKNWYSRIVVLEETLESPFDNKEIKLINPKGNQSWIFIGRIDAEAEPPILWPPDVKSRLTGKDPDAWKYWGREEKGVTEYKMVDGIIDTMDMSLSKLQGMAKDEEPGMLQPMMLQSRTWLSDWTKQ